jgi:SpoVK/Ycf46/Vps4 family AAA+-type ATPase
MFKKIINSLTLVSLILTINTYTFWYTKNPTFTDKIGYATKNVTKKVLKLSKKGGTVVAAIIATGFFGKWFFSRFIEKPLNKGSDAAVGFAADGVSKHISPAIGSFIKKTFLNEKNNDEDRLKKAGILPEDVTRSFANQDGSIDNGSIDEKLEPLIEIIGNKRINPDSDVSIPRCIILEGPSQIGKSYSADCISEALGAKKCFHIASTSLEDSLVGGTKDNIRAAFNTAKKIATEEYPCVIILDEIDFAVDIQDKHAKKALATFNEILDAMEKGNYENVYFITTTNHWQEIGTNEPTLANRFIREGGVVSLNLPSRERREFFLKNLSKKNKINLHGQKLNKIVLNTEGCNLADLSNIVKGLQTEVSNKKRELGINVNNFNKNQNINLQVPKKALLQKVKTMLEPIKTILTKKAENPAPDLTNIDDYDINLDNIILGTTKKNEIINEDENL